MTKKLTSFFVMVLLLTMTVGASDALANADAHGDVFVWESYFDGDVSILYVESVSEGYVEDSFDSDWDRSDADDWFTFAWAEIGSGGGAADTYEMRLNVAGWAAPPGGVGAFALGWAYQDIEFEAHESGPISFWVDYDSIVEANTELPGDYAFAEASLFLTLGNYATGGEAGAGYYDRLEFWDGQGDSLFNEGYLSVSLDFSTGDSGWLRIEGIGYVEAYSIPAPGAIVLAGIGAGLVTWLRRRFGG